jgi:hypothetical protein
VSIWTRAYWKATLERMVRGFAIAALVPLGGQAVDIIHGLDWQNVLGLGGGGAVLSLLLSLAGQQVSGNGPSFIKDEAVEPQPRRALIE